jgi:hypothetical protein
MLFKKMNRPKLLKAGIISMVIMAVVIATVLVGFSTVFATPGNNSACTGCHTLRGGNLRIATNTGNITVAPGATFSVNTSFTGGGSSQTEINWPNVVNNTSFTPTPRIPFSQAGSTGSGSSTLTAPATPGTYTVRVYVAQNSPTRETDYKDMTITVSAPVAAPSITTSSLAGGEVGVAYSRTLAATAGTTPYTWSVSAGTLPAGLAVNASSGVISGTPTASGTSNFTIRVTDAAARTATRALSIVVSPAPIPLAITTASLPSGMVGPPAYNQVLTANGGTTPYTWTVSAGSLPPGLTLSASTGVINGSHYREL